MQAAKQALPHELPSELRSLLLASTHRITSARDIASRYLNRLITSFPSLMCDPPLVFAILEVLTLLRRACENEFLDEVRGRAYVTTSALMTCVRTTLSIATTLIA